MDRIHDRVELGHTVGCMHNAGMVNVTIRGVPDEVRDELARRASQRGQSLQEYLSHLLQRTASNPDEIQVLERIRQRTRLRPARLTDDEIVTAIREGRRE